MAFRTDGELRVLSDWPVHQPPAGEMRIGYLDYPDNKAANRPDGDGTLRLRIDAARDTRFEVEGRYLVTTQRTGSPDLNTATRERPLVAPMAARSGWCRTSTGSRSRCAASSTVRPTRTRCSSTGGGGAPERPERQPYGLACVPATSCARALTPFVDVLLDTRVHDRAVDFSGFRRDSDGITARIGTTFRVSELLSGEVSGGVLSRSYVDPRLRTLTGPVVDGAVIWAATALTSVRFGASTGVAETIVPGASGILNRTAVAEVTHDLRRNLRLSLVGLAYENEYQGGVDPRARLLGGPAPRLRGNRWLGLRAS